jgi:hypothetical protein
MLDERLGKHQDLCVGVFVFTEVIEVADQLDVVRLIAATIINAVNRRPKRALFVFD